MLVIRVCWFESFACYVQARAKGARALARRTFSHSTAAAGPKRLSKCVCIFSCFECACIVLPSLVDCQLETGFAWCVCNCRLLNIHSCLSSVWRCFLFGFFFIRFLQSVLHLTDPRGTRAYHCAGAKLWFEVRFVCFFGPNHDDGCS